MCTFLTLIQNCVRLSVTLLAFHSLPSETVVRPQKNQIFFSSKTHFEARRTFLFGVWRWVCAGVFLCVCENHNVCHGISINLSVMNLRYTCALQQYWNILGCSGSPIFS